MWVVAKRETVVEGINIINPPASKIFQTHVLTRTGGIMILIPSTTVSRFAASQNPHMYF